MSSMLISAVLLLHALMMGSIMTWFKDPIEEIDSKNENYWVENVHNLALKCMRESGSPFGYADIQLKSEKDRRRHYRELTKVTEPYWSIPPHLFAGYTGPWLDNQFRDHFINKDVSEFGPFIPFYTQWEDMLFRTKWNNDYSHEANASMMYLRPDYLYVTVSMSDFGIQGNFSVVPSIPPTLFTIAGNGRAHMPCMLTKRPLKYRPLLPPKYLISFVGKNRGVRPLITSFFKKEFGDAFYHNLTNNWIAISRESIIGLSPRGKGRGCFRTTELLELGVIPAIIWDDYPWVPYLNSSLPWKDIGFISNIENLPNLALEMRNLTTERIKFMQKTILKYQKSHFSLEGTMNQIHLFFKYGYARSDLRCDKFYSTF